MKEIIDEIKDRAKNHFKDKRGSHDFDHTMRVYKLSLHIGKIEKSDLTVLKIASLLHDIGREHQDRNNGDICHAEYGSKIAKNILKDYNIKKERFNNIIHCIKSHRFRNNFSPKTIEAKVLFDSDKLDSIGAVGIGRAFLFAGENNAKLHDKNVDIENTSSYSREDTAYREYLVKLKFIKDKMMTEEGKRMAEKRHKFMVKFFDRINKEVEGII